MNPTTRSSQPVRLDPRGVPVTTPSNAALDQLEHAILGFVGHRADTAQRLECALASDPLLVPALCLQGFAYKALGRTDLEPEARKKLSAAREALRARGGSDRERGLCHALDAWCRHEPLAASETLARVVQAHPRDLLAYKLSHAVDFILGRSVAMRATCERALPAWDERTPGYAYALGCYAFALEETGALAQAERAGRRAVALEPLDAWGAHAVAHVLEVRDESAEGLAWMDAVGAPLEGCNNFGGHLAWHTTLFHLQRRELDAALALYDARIAPHLGRDYRDIANCATLLWRLEREGMSVGARWQPLGELARARLGDHGLAFADTHYVMALAGAGDLDGAERFVGSMREAARTRHGLYADVAAQIGVPLAEGIVALAAGMPDRALGLMLAAVGQNARLGGSRAQRDVFSLMAIEAAVQGSRPRLARSLLAQRLRVRPSNRFASERLARLDARERAGSRPVFARNAAGAAA